MQLIKLSLERYMVDLSSNENWLGRGLYLDLRWDPLCSLIEISLISFKSAVAAWHATQVQKKCYTAHTHRKYVRMATPTTQACNNSELSKGISPTLFNFKLKNSSQFSIQNSNTNLPANEFLLKATETKLGKQTKKVRVQQRCYSTPKVKYEIKRFTMRSCKRFN
jgi:hypothetical protein